MQHNYKTLLECNAERLHPTKMRIVSGSVPNNLKGTYFKIGPTYTPLQSHHILDGNGFVVKVVFPGDGQTPIYQCRFIDTKCRRSNRHGNIFSGPITSVIRNPSNTNIVYWDKKVTAWYDGGAPIVLDPFSLDTLPEAFLDYQDGAALTTHVPTIDAIFRRHGVFGDAVNAHPKIDSKGNLVCMELKYGPFSTQITFRTTTPSSNVSRCQELWVEGIAYMHDFVVTERHIVVIHHPLHLDVTQALLHKTGFAQALKQNKNRPSTLYLIDRRTGEIKAIELEGSFFVSHHIRSSYTKDMFCLSSVCYPSFLELGGFIKKIEINTKTGNLIKNKNISKWIEFPVQARSGEIYATCSSNGDHPMQELCRLTLDKGSNLAVTDSDKEYQTWWGEPAISRDHVIAFTKTQKNNRTNLEILDLTLKNHLCRLDFEDSIVPIGLHGTFLRDIVF